MAPWGDTKLFFCFFIITCYCAVTSAQVLMDCCMQASPKVLENRTVVDYRLQVAERGCRIEAMIFITRHGRKLCIDPNQSWIPGAKKHVDELKKICKARKYKTKRCFGVKRE